MLTVKSLASRRSRRLVFRGVGFELGEGGLLLVTGRNGSGKSSLLRALAGLLPIFEGEMAWQGEAVRDFASHRARLHYLGHLDALKPELNPEETLAYWKSLYGEEPRLIPEPDIPGSEILGAFGLASSRQTKIRHLSAGQKRRLALARLLIGNAPLWLLDEPGTSLDTLGQALLDKLIGQHRAKGGMAIIASHDEHDFPDTQHLSLDHAGAAS
jgi:heme exporter protein A